jgi:hypothetical protein
MTRIQNILVPVDFTKSSLYAARYAACLAQTHNARLYVLHVRAPFPVHGRIVAGSLENVQKHQIRNDQAELPKVIPAMFKNSSQTVRRGCHRDGFAGPQGLAAFFQKKYNRTRYPQCPLLDFCSSIAGG